MARENIPVGLFYASYPSDCTYQLNSSTIIKKLVLKYGGAGHYTRSQAFFLGLISGQALCNGTWLIVDYFTGKVGNAIFWV